MSAETVLHQDATAVGLLDLLEDAARGDVVLRFPSDGTGELTFSDLWGKSAGSADWLSGRAEVGEAVAIIMTPSPALLSALIGCWRAGLVLASLPLPGRGMPVAEYTQQIRAMCAAVGAKGLIAEGRYSSMLPDLGLPVWEAEQCTGGPAGRRSMSSGSFVQFTSGSTQSPKGVELTLTSMAANVAALVAATEPDPGYSVVSWLPLSHDMGFIGTLLTGIAAGAPQFARRGSVAVLRPETFIGQPGIWMRTCSALSASHTAAPSFAFELAARALTSGPGLDLSSMRVVITGGELVRAAALRAFQESAAPHAFDPRAICPAYGMAEATLAVTMVPPGRRWESVVVDPVELGAGRWVATDKQDCAREIVGCGTPIPSMRVRSGAPPGEPGTLEVAGPSLFRRYVGSADAPPPRDGWFRTSDAGVVGPQDLYVIGRNDDLILAGGRNLYCQDLERTATDADERMRRGNVVAVADGDGRYVVVAELRTGAVDADSSAIAKAVRRALVQRHGIGPTTVRFVPPGYLPKTPSGKPQRHKVRAALLRDELPVVSS